MEVKAREAAMKAVEEIVRRHRESGGLHSDLTDTVFYQSGYNMGHSSRDVEVAALAAENGRLLALLKDECICHQLTDRAGHFRELPKNSGECYVCRSLTPSPSLGEEVVECLRFYADSFRIMDFISGTYEIKDEWYGRARALLAKLGSVT